MKKEVTARERLWRLAYGAARSCLKMPEASESQRDGYIRWIDEQGGPRNWKHSLYRYRDRESRFLRIQEERTRLREAWLNGPGTE